MGDTSLTMKLLARISLNIAPQWFLARDAVAPTEQCEAIFAHVQRALKTINGLWSGPLSTMLATKRESVPDLDGTPCSAYRFAGGVVADMLCSAYQHMMTAAVP